MPTPVLASSNPQRQRSNGSSNISSTGHPYSRQQTAELKPSIEWALAREGGAPALTFASACEERRYTSVPGRGKASPFLLLLSRGRLVCGKELLFSWRLLALPFHQGNELFTVL